MSKFVKVLAAAILIAGCASTAHAGQVKTPTLDKVHASVTLQKAAARKVVRKINRLPIVRNVATHAPRTVRLYNVEPTRSKIVGAKPAKTSTPNLFIH